MVPKSWYQLQLRVMNKDISASIDGTLFSYVLLFNSSNDWIAIGSSWDYVQFDDLIITSLLDMDDDH
jgi:hypothetical protein